jgi:hypothetical protein
MSRLICRLLGHRWMPVALTYDYGCCWGRVGDESRMTLLPVAWCCDEMCSRCGAETWWPS